VITGVKKDRGGPNFRSRIVEKNGSKRAGVDYSKRKKPKKGDGRTIPWETRRSNLAM